MPISAQSHPPQVLQIHRDPLKPGSDAAYRKIEENAARICVELGCPHPYLAIESLTGPKSARFERGVPWSIRLGRFLVITVTKGNGRVDGTVFETADGTRFIVMSAQTRKEADAKAAAAGPEAPIFAIRPYWCLPAKEWIAADPVF